MGGLAVMKIEVVHVTGQTGLVRFQRDLIKLLKQRQKLSVVHRRKLKNLKFKKRHRSQPNGHGSVAYYASALGKMANTAISQTTEDDQADGLGALTKNVKRTENPQYKGIEHQAEIDQEAVRNQQQREQGNSGWSNWLGNALTEEDDETEGLKSIASNLPKGTKFQGFSSEDRVSSNDPSGMVKVQQQQVASPTSDGQSRKAQAVLSEGMGPSGVSGGSNSASATMTSNSLAVGDNSNEGWGNDDDSQFE
eukprot:Tbor_TRINITY_DN4556_c0_g2::TRINITY_DN4556_c0_g2_i1::g.15859::m.15859